MTQSSGTVAGTPALSFGQRVVGMLFSPRATFESVVAHPKWLDVLLLTICVGTAAFGAFVLSPVGGQAMKDQMVAQAERAAEARGQNAAPAVDRIDQIFPILRIGLVIAPLIVGFAFVLMTTGLLYGVFAALLGGGGTYKQVLAVVTHAGVVFQLGQLVVLTLNYVRATMTSATTLAVFAPMLPEDSFFFKLLGAIDLVWIWYLIILAMGLAVLYRRKTASIATSFFGVYLVIAVIRATLTRGA
jgi:hypothetical protein